MKRTNIDERLGSGIAASKGNQARDVTVSEPYAAPDLNRVRAYRLKRVRDELKTRDLAGVLLYDPINIRYATGSVNQSVWTLHNAARYAFVPTEGGIVLFEFHGCSHLADGLETINEIRPATPWFYFAAGPRVEEKALRWAYEIAELVTLAGGSGNKRLAVDKCDPTGSAALRSLGVELFDGQEILEQARAIKSVDEVLQMRAAVSVCEQGMAAMREALRPGMTENQLWSILHQVNIAHGGEWIETRLLTSGSRTNPWFQECSDRVIEAGDLVSFDTDLIGPFGMCADISRTFLCGDGKPTEEQSRLYGLAMEQIHHNMNILGPGVTLPEMAHQAWQLPPSCLANRYAVVIHGVGMCDEYPYCPYQEDFDAAGYDGTLLPGMTVCVESYIGEVGGREGVKLEQQILITDRGVEQLSSFPYEERLYGPRWI